MNFSLPQARVFYCIGAQKNGQTCWISFLPSRSSFLAHIFPAPGRNLPRASCVATHTGAATQMFPRAGVLDARARREISAGSGGPSGALEPPGESGALCKSTRHKTLAAGFDLIPKAQGEMRMSVSPLASPTPAGYEGDSQGGRRRARSGAEAI